MTTTRVAPLAWGALLLLTPLLSAQGLVVKKKVVSPDQYQQLTEAATTPTALGGEGLHNGDMVSLRRKGVEGRLNGTFVYEDAKTSRIFVRPRAGEAPVPVALKDIEDVERIVPASTSGGKDGVRFATDDGPRARHREIYMLEIYNGPVKEVRYYGPNLSPAEKQELAALQKAANELTADQETAVHLERSLNEQPTPAELMAQQYRLASMLALASTSGFTYSNYGFNPSPYNFGGNLFYPAVSGPYFGGTMPIINTVAAPAPTPAAGQAPQPSQAELMKSLKEARERVEQDRQALASLRNRAILDSDGSIVAVRLDEK